MPALPETEPDGTERRVAPRMRTLKRAKVIFNNGYSTFDCIVRNLSATGALLTIDESAHLPKEFMIVVGDGMDPRPAKLVYRRGLFAGIRFRDIPDEMEEGASGAPKSHPNASMSTAQQARGRTSGGQHYGMADQHVSGIRRIEPERLPKSLVRLFPWS